MRKISFIAIFASSLILLAATAAAEGIHQPGSVIELYTSQGCSSCPPADKLMGQLVQDKNILGLSFAVTYWDYIGWKDTFGSPANDARQANYRDSFHARYVYTPQMIVDGRTHVVGSDRDGVEALMIQDAKAHKPLALTWSVTGDLLQVHLPTEPDPATIWLIGFDHAKSVDIGRGENTGRRLTYYNIVRDIRNFGAWDGKSRTLEFDLADMRAGGNDSCALIIQKAGYGPILAALSIPLSN